VWVVVVVVDSWQLNPVVVSAQPAQASAAHPAVAPSQITAAAEKTMQPAQARTGLSYVDAARSIA